MYFWERKQLHGFLKNLISYFELIIWSSLSKELTGLIVEHIQRKMKYFSFVLNREDCMNFEERKPTNIALSQDTLQLAKKNQQENLMDMSFSRIDRSLYPPRPVKDLTLLTKN